MRIRSREKNLILSTLSSLVVGGHGLRILQKLLQTTLSINHKILTCQGLSKYVCCLVLSSHIDHCRFPILSIWVYMLMCPMKLNSKMLGPLVEHRVVSQIWSTLTVKMMWVCTEPSAARPPSPEATPVPACQHTLPDRGCRHCCLEIGLPHYWSSRRKDYVSRCRSCEVDQWNL